MNYINLKISPSLILILFSALLFTFPALAEEDISEKAQPDETMTDEHAQKIFDLAMEERDS